jgi:hypothetical protein
MRPISITIWAFTAAVPSRFTTGSGVTTSTPALIHM